MKIINNKKSNKKGVSNKNSWSVIIDKLRYVDGSVYYSDKNRITPFHTYVEDMNVFLDDFSSKPGENNGYYVKAVTQQGTSVGWKGQFSLSPLKSNGQVEISSNLMLLSDYLYDQILLKINYGRLDLISQYDFKYSNKGGALRVNDLIAAIKNINISRKDNGKKVLAWETLEVNLAEFDLENKKLVIDRISSKGIYARLDIKKEMGLDFGGLFVFQNHVNENMEAESVLPTVMQKKWDVYIKDITNNDALFDIVDASIEPIANHNVRLEFLGINNLKLFENELALLEMKLNINNDGLVHVSGDIRPASRMLNIQLNSELLEVKKFQPYINKFTRATIEDGLFSTNLQIKVDGGVSPPAVLLQGDMGLKQFSLQDMKLKESFLIWDELNIKGIDFRYPEKKISVSEVVFDKPYLRLVVNENGKTNIQKIVVNKESENANNVLNKANKKSNFQAEIKNINIKNGKMDFSDYSLTPSFKAGVYQLKGTIQGLSSNQLSKAKVNLKGKIDKYAPVVISGDINPLTEDAFTKIKMSFKGIELTTFTPYSAKFAGYKIEKGKLTLGLDYHLSKNKLVAKNHVVLDQLTLGDRVESKDAINLPVKFALSLLRNANGVIDFNLPIQGNVDDPDFQYGNLVWDAMGNMLLGIVSSPFNALATLVEGDAKGLDYIVFQAGQATLLKSEKVKLELLTKALLQRPALYLEVAGVSSSLIDHDEIAYAKILQTLKLKPMKLNQALNEDDQEKIIDYYESLTSKIANDLLPKKYQLTDEQQLEIIFDKALFTVLNIIQVTPDEYRELARKRAVVIQSYMIEMGKVPASSIFLRDSKTDINNELEDVERALLKLPLTLKAK